MRPLTECVLISLLIISLSGYAGDAVSTYVKAPRKPTEEELKAQMLKELGPCPATLREWQASLRKFIDRAFSAKLERKRDREFNAADLNILFQKLDQCEQELKKFPRVLECAGPALGLREAMSSGKKSYRLNYNISDVDYEKRMDHPEMMELPALITSASFLSSFETRNSKDSELAILDSIEKINARIPDASMKWSAFPYNSAHLPTVDSVKTLGRFIIYVPGRDFDQFIQFAYPYAEKKNGSAIVYRPGSQISLVAVQKTDKKGRPLARPQVRFKDFWRVREYDVKAKAIKIRLSDRLTETGMSENCYNCHKAGVLPIIPKGEIDQKKFGAALARLNAAARKFATAELPGVKKENWGPPFGPPKSVLRSDAFLLKCGGPAIASERLPRLRELMNCARCHDGRKEELLNFQTGLLRMEGSTLSHHFIVNHEAMPPDGGDLTPDERRALSKCLEEEYYEGDGDRAGLLQEWLYNDACWNREKGAPHESTVKGAAHRTTIAPK